MHLCITSALGYDGIALEGENTVGKSNKMRWTEILQYNRYTVSDTGTIQKYIYFKTIQIFMLM